MGKTNFQFEGQKSLQFDVDLNQVDTLDTLQRLVGSNFGVIKPEELSFHQQGVPLEDIHEIKAASPSHSVTIQVAGHSVRPVPGPTGLPIVGNYFEVFPDHLGNNLRLFEKYGPIFQTNNLGRISCLTNDPELSTICLSETEYFSKDITPEHPLYPIKNQKAGVFLGDTNDPSWKIVHKFLPPALGPKAVRHYAPTMNDCVNATFKVFDELESQEVAWNCYQYMIKLTSSTIGRIILGVDFGHFKTIDAPLHKIVTSIAENLVLNKRIASRGEWYSHLPFGDPVRLKNLTAEMTREIEKCIDTFKSDDNEDLELQDAALKAQNAIDYLNRAVDSKGEHLPKENLVSAVIVATGTGFTSTSSLISWCLYSAMTYPGMQTRLLQEMIDHGINDETDITAEQIDEMPELTKFIKEVQRRHNPSFQPARTAQKDLILPGGYQLKKGAVVVAAIHHIHNNPKLWGNPAEFDPDRWDTQEVKNLPKGSYIPFAYGQRMCIGYHFALLATKIALCKLIYRYHWVKDGDSHTEYDPEFQLIRPVNLYVRTRRRQKYPTKSVA